MRFSADHYFHIGALHLSNGKPCQDYVDVKDLGTSMIMVLSDGCSSGGRTDLGSRMVVLSGLLAMEKAMSMEASQRVECFLKEQSELLNKSKSLLSLDVSDLLATSVVLQVSESGAEIYVQGDGVIVFKYRNSAMRVLTFSWENNQPYYPAYELLNSADFYAAHSAAPMTQSEYRIDDTGQVVSVETRVLNISEICPLLHLSYSLKELGDDLEYIAIFSDGCEQSDGMKWLDFIQECLAFKTVKGDFLKRRMIRLLKNMMQNGQRIMDDISVAVIHITGEDGD